MSSINITISALLTQYRDGTLTPETLIDHLLEKCEQFDDRNIWIHRLSKQEIEPYLQALEKHSPDSLPLYGIPFAIKDNLDLAGIPTTAACKGLNRRPTQHAFVVEQLINAGAIPVGKTNLDQFATGLVGTRSPWGACRNAFNPDYVSGGSSSGSAVALALGLVSFSLGTDTAGSGRVPAAFNNLVGLKATKGLLSSTGMVPACRSLDVTSIFALTAEDASRVFDVTTQYDPSDAYARQNTYANSARVKGVAKGKLLLGVPQKDQLHFFGDSAAEHDFAQSVAQWEKLGAEIVPLDFSPFLDAAHLLYEGPWVSERSIATKAVLENAPETLDPSVKKIVEGGVNLSAELAFTSQYKLAECKRLADQRFAKIDLLLTPTAPTCYTIDAMQADPISLNSNLGYYTNYMNLLDYAGIALPHASFTTPVPNGFTLVGKAFEDQKLLAWARFWQDHNPAHLGNTDIQYQPSDATTFNDASHVKVVVCGAHLSGEPLNWQLQERGAHLVKATQSSPHYRLYALADGKRPGMERVKQHGMAIEVEVWNMPTENFGSFVAGIPSPLAIGKVELADGSWESGFICDAYGLEGATDISEFGGWRAYLSASS